MNGESDSRAEQRESLNQAAAFELGYRADADAKNPYDEDPDDWAIAGAWTEGHDEAFHDRGRDLAERLEQLEDTPCIEPRWRDGQ